MKTSVIILLLVACTVTSRSQQFERFNAGGKWGLKKPNGDTIVPARYDSIGSFLTPLIAVLKDEHWGFIDTSGKVVTAFKYDSYEYAKPFFPLGVLYNGSWGFINSNGKEITGFKYSQLLKDRLDTIYKYTRAVKEQRNNRQLVTFIDTLGKEITAGFENADPFRDDLARVYSKKKYGFINRKGKVVIRHKFDLAWHFAEGFAAVNTGYIMGLGEEKGLWGYIDKEGQYLVTPKYHDARNFSEGLAAVQYLGKWGYVDANGNSVTNFSYDEAGFFKEGKAKVRIEGSEYYIDKTGKKL